MSAVEVNAAEIRARLVKANRLVGVLASCGLSGDDVRVLVAAAAPVLDDVVRVAEVRTPSAVTWETVAVLLDERSRLTAALSRTPAGYMPDPSDPFSGTS